MAAAGLTDALPADYGRLCDALEARGLVLPPPALQGARRRVHAPAAAGRRGGGVT
jgi:hypothetical protein